MLRYGIQSFGWLLPFGQHLDAAGFAGLIAEHYSTENPRTAAIVEGFRLLAEDERRAASDE